MLLLVQLLLLQSRLKCGHLETIETTSMLMPIVIYRIVCIFAFSINKFTVFVHISSFIYNCTYKYFR